MTNECPVLEGPTCPPWIELLFHNSPGPPDQYSLPRQASRTVFRIGGSYRTTRLFVSRIPYSRQYRPTLHWALKRRPLTLGRYSFIQQDGASAAISTLSLANWPTLQSHFRCVPSEDARRRGRPVALKPAEAVPTPKAASSYKTS